jgi:hypothetical protein
MKYIIYKITIEDYTYIGSTKDFNQRKKTHKSTCKTNKLMLYQFIRQNGGWDKCEMTPIEEYECEGQIQARIREEYWRREYNAVLNTIKAYSTNQERIQQNCEKFKCQCGGKYTHARIRTHERTNMHLKYLEEQKSHNIITYGTH